MIVLEEKAPEDLRKKSDRLAQICADLSSHAQNEPLRRVNFPIFDTYKGPVYSTEPPPHGRGRPSKTREVGGPAGIRTLDPRLSSPAVPKAYTAKHDCVIILARLRARGVSREPVHLKPVGPSPGKTFRPGGRAFHSRLLV